jgi:hypothetical protein
MKISNAAKSPKKISKRGGARAGAGRKPGSKNKLSEQDKLAEQAIFDSLANALVKALDGAIPLEFIIAMWALGQPLDAARAALGMTEDAFGEEYGEAIAVFIARQKAGLLAEELGAQTEPPRR